MQNTLPSFSVVIEWENVRNSEIGRARRMLSELSRQITALDGAFAEPPELIVLYDPEAINPARVRQLIEEGFPQRRDVPIRLLPTPQGSYYRQKNHGASIAKNELVMFLDSDVVPEGDWLENLIGSFRDERVEIVCGNTYIETADLYSKAFALFWFFPPRNSAGGLAPSDRFFANNVVFRRDVFLKYGFPELPYVRGQCAALASALCADKRGLYIQNSARVSHPPPNGVAHFVKRALCEGHDKKHRDWLQGTARPLRTSLARYAGSLNRSARCIGRHHRSVGLGVPGAAAAVAVAWTYYSLCLAGEVVTTVNPHLIRRRFIV